MLCAICTKVSFFLQPKCVLIVRHNQPCVGRCCGQRLNACCGCRTYSMHQGSMQHVITGGPDNMTYKQKGAPRTRSFASVSSMACRTSANALLLTGVTALAISNRPCTRSPDAPCLASPVKNPCRYFSAKSSSSPAPPLSRLCA
jgi:hypothetical protein